MAPEIDTPAWKASLLEGITAFPHVYTIVTCSDTTHDLSPVFEADKDAYYARQVQEYCKHIQSSLHAKASAVHEEVQTLRDEYRDLKKEVATLDKVIDRVGAPKHTTGQLPHRQTRDHPTFNATEKDIEKRQEEYVGWRSKAMRNLAVDKTIYNTEFRRLQYIGRLWEWKTADDLIEFLNSQYETIDLDRTASRNFDNYFMTNKPFENFIAEFNKLATLAGKTDKQKVEALQLKVSNEVIDEVMHRSGKPGNDDWPGWKKLCQDVYNDLEQSKHIRKMRSRREPGPRSASDNPRPNNPPAPAAPIADAGEPMQLSASSTSEARRRERQERGLCYYCGGTHRIRDCQEKMDNDANLVDSGCSARAFADRGFIRTNKIQTEKLPKERTLILADGKVADNITHYVILPVIPSPRSRPHDIAPPTESQPSRQRDQAYIEDTEDEGYGSGDSIRTASSYRPPSIEDSDDKESRPEGGVELDIPQTLTPGQDHYHTFRPNPPRFPLEPETRARMIPDRPQLKPAPVTLKAGSRRPVHQEYHGPPKPQLSVPIPPTPNGARPPDPYDRPDLSDIKMLAATNFLQFCKGGATQCMKITWPELDAIQTETPLLKLPDLPESVFHNILEKRGDHAAVSQLFPSAFHDFLDDCYSQEHLRRVTDADVDKFLKGKPDLSQEDIKARLPERLQDKITGFLPHLANELPPRRGWDHRIELTPYQKNRQLSPRELLVVRKWLDDNLSKGFIRESRARCAAPLLLAAKPGGGVPLPLIRENLDALCHAKYYTKLDVIAAFNKLRLAEGHEWKTAFITRFGLFESLVMPFGLCNAPASFQHYINHTLYDLLDKICTAYLDDVLVYSQTRKEHRQHVREVIDRLIEAGLQIDINKCEFETTKTKYLGLIIASDGIQMDPDKVATVTGWEKPANVRELQRFLGFANFYRRFIRDFSSICRPLNDLLRKESAWRWAERQQHAFMQLKTAFTTGPALVFFDYNRKTVLETDASDWASGGVLSQYDDDGSLRPVAYFSSKHSAAECNYEIYDKELLAIIKA
ncbi:hypothetical protein MANI_115950 [Metarhizium anisopliae]|nr:hypothetical protein MANI_115950 [Metarhizium anisopliae]